MIVEIGHFALVLALCAAIAQTVVPSWGARLARSGADGRRAERRADPACAGGGRLRRARRRPSDLGLFRPQCGREFAQRSADDLQDLRRMGKSRRLDAAVGPDSRDFRGAGVVVRTIPAARAPRERARRAGPHRRRFPALHPLDVEPVRAPRSGAVRGTRPQSDPPGPRPRGPPADALSRLCRLLDRLLVRRRGPDRRADRRRLGALRAAICAGRLEPADPRHRRGLFLGLLHAGLGRVLVLGPGRECLPHALARRNRVRPFSRGDGEARRVESVDDLSRDPCFLIFAARHVPGALGRPDLGARLRQRSAPRRLHPRHPRLLHHRLVRALCLARADAEAGWHLRAGIA